MRCRKCKKRRKLVESFRRGLCEKCHQQASKRKYYQTYRSKILRKVKKYYRRNSKKICAYQREYRRKNLGRVRAYDRSRQNEKKGRVIGWSRQDVRNAWKKQRGRCAICKRRMARFSKKRTMCRDHDHQTGLRRELLCFKCNIGLGSFGDDPRVLEKAARYIRKHRRP